MRSLPPDGGIAMATDDRIDGARPAASGTAPIDAEELRRRTAFSRDISAGLGQLVSLMVRSRLHRFTMLAELEWMIVPAVLTRQVRVAEAMAQEIGMVMPIAAVIWASVSAEVDKRLSESLDAPIRLKPDEWRSGPNVWIVETLGDSKAVSAMLQHLKQTDLKDRTVRIRVRGQDGRITIGRVELQPEAADGASG